MDVWSWKNYLEVAADDGGVSGLRFKKRNIDINQLFTKLGEGARYHDIKDSLRMDSEELLALKHYFKDALTPTSSEEFTGTLEARDGGGIAVKGRVEYADPWDYCRLHLDPLQSWPKEKYIKLGESEPLKEIVGRTSSGSEILIKFYGSPGITNKADGSRTVLLTDAKAVYLGIKATGYAMSASAKLRVEFYLKNARGGVGLCRFETGNYIITYVASCRNDAELADQYTGRLIIESGSDPVASSEAWLVKCNELAQFVLLIVSFALGGRIDWSVKKIFVHDRALPIEKIIWPCAVVAASRINAVHFLNLQPILEAAINSFEKYSSQEREAIGTAISWYLSGDTVESMFIATSIAVEHLVEKILGPSHRTIMEKNQFKRLRRKIRVAIDGEILSYNPGEIAAICDKLGELNRRSAEDNVYQLLSHYNVRNRDLGNLIAEVIKRRNGITHRGIMADGGRFGDIVDRAADEIFVRIIQAALGLRDRNMQYPLVLDCEDLFPELTSIDLDGGELRMEALELFLVDTRSNTDSMRPVSISGDQAGEEAEVSTLVQPLDHSVMRWLQTPEVTLRLDRHLRQSVLGEAFYFREHRDGKTWRVGLKASRQDGKIWLIVGDL